MTADDRLEVFKIATAMNEAGLPIAFIDKVAQLAQQDEGVFELLVMWSQEEERDAAVDALQELVEDHENEGPIERPYIRFDDLEAIAANIVAFKTKLRDKVDAWGGISRLSRVTGIPQPSLSRLFSSAAMPRRTTLYKIAKAMDLSAAEIATEWSR
jgi:DNA-binding phage protein